MGKFKVSKVDRENSNKPTTNTNVCQLVTARPDNPASNFIRTKSSSGPFTRAGASVASKTQFNTALCAGTSAKTPSFTTDANGSDTTEPLLDYEDYFKEEEDAPSRKKSSKKGKGPKKKSSELAPKNISLAEQIGKQISNIRSYACWRKPRDLREETRQNVRASRAKNREKILHKRRCASVYRDPTTEDREQPLSGCVGVTDPDIHGLVWNFRRLNVVEASTPRPWKVSRDRKRVAPPMNTVFFNNAPEGKRRKIQVY